MNDAVIQALTAAAEASPDDHVLRLHLAELLVEAGRAPEAVRHCALVLSHDPTNTEALELLGRASAPPKGGARRAAPSPSTPPQAPQTPADVPTSNEDDDFDWERAEAEVGGPAPAFVSADPGPAPADELWELEDSDLTLDHVAGMDEAKRAIDRQLLGPLRNPELSRAFGKTLRGGLLLYGPPGCGKTFIARAVAGEMGARFISVSVADVLDMYIGCSERNMHSLFASARRNAPVVLFFDEVDALGMRRGAQGSNQHLRGVTNQFLTELDGVGSDNEGVFVMAATNQPWDVDPALRRPGRFDRTVLVLPPDAPAREAIFRHHLADRPVTDVDLGWLAAHSDGLTGADIARVCEDAVESALADSMTTDLMRLVTMDDLRAGLKATRPSAGPWFSSARNVVTYANTDGTYDELKAYMSSRRLL